MQLVGRRPAAAKPSMNGLGGIYALVEERRERGYFGSGRRQAHAAESASAKESATKATAGDSAASTARPVDAAEDEEK